MDYNELTSSLKKSLLKHQYVEVDPEGFGKFNFLKIFKTKTKLGVKILFVVVELPDDVATVPDFSKYFNSVRNALTKKYAKFPYWKDLGTLSVFLCKDKEYNIFKTEINRFKDKTGLHTNIMLGTILINTDKLVFSHCLTWGLFETGKHFETIKNTISGWIASKNII